VWLFFAAQGAAPATSRCGERGMNNFLLISRFFLDGLANAAEQLCGRAYGARAATNFRRGAARGVLGLALRSP